MEKDLIQEETNNENVENNNVVSQTSVNQTVVPEETKTSVDDYMGKAVRTIQRKVNENAEGMDYKTGIKEIANIAVTAKALDDSNPDNDEFLDRLKKTKQFELEQEFLSEQFKAEATKYAAKQAKAEAFYTNFRPILEFDFSHLIPKTKKNTLFKPKVKNDRRSNMMPMNQTDAAQTEEPSQKTPVTYKDRSYGIPLMILMLCLLTIPYCVVSIILALANGVNAIFDGIARFGKPALIICGSIMCIIIMLLVVYGSLCGIDLLFGTNIIHSVIK